MRSQRLNGWEDESAENVERLYLRTGCPIFTLPLFISLIYERETFGIKVKEPDINVGEWVRDFLVIQFMKLVLLVS